MVEMLGLIIVLLSKGTRRVAELSIPTIRRLGLQAGILALTRLPALKGTGEEAGLGREPGRDLGLVLGHSLAVGHDRGLGLDLGIEEGTKGLIGVGLGHGHDLETRKGEEETGLGPDPGLGQDPDLETEKGLEDTEIDPGVGLGLEAVTEGGGKIINKNPILKLNSNSFVKKKQNT